MTDASPTLTLRSGAAIPMIGLGTWKSDPGQVYDAVRHALAHGYRHIDCAAIYKNEPEVGQAIADAIKAGDVTREQLWVTSKLWNNRHEKHRVGDGLEQTLRDLQLDALDLYLIHWPVASPAHMTREKKPTDLIPLTEQPLEATWEGMLEQREQGKSRHVGVSNFSLKKVELLTTLEAPAMNQVELHPHLQQTALLAGCQALGVAITGYSPLGSPDSAGLFFGREDGVRLLDNPTITAIAQRLGATNAQVLLAWGRQRGTVVIPKSTTPHRIDENLASAKLTLSDDDMQAIASLDRHHRYIDGSFWCGKGSPHTLATLWDE